MFDIFDWREHARTADLANRVIPADPAAPERKLTWRCPCGSQLFLAPASFVPEAVCHYCGSFVEPREACPSCHIVDGHGRGCYLAPEALR